MVKTCIECNKNKCMIRDIIYSINFERALMDELQKLIPDLCKDFEPERDMIRKEF